MRIGHGLLKYGWSLGLLAGFAICLFSPGRVRAAAPLRISVYATASDVSRHLVQSPERDRVVEVLRTLRVSRVFLEGRRGDEYVSAQQLGQVRQFLTSKGIHSSGGIATVPGKDFGTRQTGTLTWLNWESPATRSGITGFFSENSPVFDELIVDDFYCTADVSEASAAARGGRTWSEYRRDLMVSLVPPLMLEPARNANPQIRLIIKFPQWYDRFHLFGYDPLRLAPMFDQVWVGTEVRNPLTRRMGYVQPTQGYVNFRWLSSVTGGKTVGAWFDHIECTPENFIDQAFLSVLAGAGELTLFNLGDVAGEHPGDKLLARRMPELFELSDKVRSHAPRGVAFYKPPSSEADDNLYLADYLAMIGLPILPVSDFPTEAKVAFLPAQAAADAGCLAKTKALLRSGATVVMTPAFIRKAGPEAAQIAGVGCGPEVSPLEASSVRIGRKVLTLPAPLQMDGAVTSSVARVRAETTDPKPAPLLTTYRVSGVRVLVLNVRTFSEEDFKSVGEWLLPPLPRGLSDVPMELAMLLRTELASPLGVVFEGPSRVACLMFESARCYYNFQDDTIQVRCNSETHRLPGHSWLWVKSER